MNDDMTVAEQLMYGEADLGLSRAMDVCLALGIKGDMPMQKFKQHQRWCERLETMLASGDPDLPVTQGSNRAWIRGWIRGRNETIHLITDG